MNSACIIHKSRINVVKYLFFRVKPIDTSYIHMVYLVWQTRGAEGDIMKKLLLVVLIICCAAAGGFALLSACVNGHTHNLEYHAAQAPTC